VSLAFDRRELDFRSATLPSKLCGSHSRASSSVSLQTGLQQDSANLTMNAVKTVTNTITTESRNNTKEPGDKAVGTISAAVETVSHVIRWPPAS